MAIPTILKIWPKTPQILVGIWAVLPKIAGLKPKNHLFLPLCNAVLTTPQQGKTSPNIAKVGPHLRPLPGAAETGDSPFEQWTGRGLFEGPRGGWKLPSKGHRPFRISGSKNGEKRSSETSYDSSKTTEFYWFSAAFVKTQRDDDISAWLLTISMGIMRRGGWTFLESQKDDEKGVFGRCPVGRLLLKVPWFIVQGRPRK